MPKKAALKVTPASSGEASSDSFQPRGAQPKGRTLTGNGNIANACTFLIMVLGVALRAQDTPLDGCEELSQLSSTQWASKWLLAVGLFGFAGGFTNWLALTMLFDEIPYLAGSGIIPKRFMEIREVGKATIMASFFSPEYLDAYMRKKIAVQCNDPATAEKLIAKMEEPEIDAMIDKRLEDLVAAPEFMMFAMMGMTAPQLKPMVKSFAASLFTGFMPLLPELVDTADMTDKIREMADEVMTQKLAEITAEEVKRLAEEVLWEYLEMLIVWGNVFGALIGVISVGAGYP